MFKKLECAAEVDIRAFEALTRTWKDILAMSEHYPVVLLNYDNIPPLFERAMLKSIAEVADESFDQISFDLNRSPSTRPILFLVPSSTDSIPEKLLQITQHLVESEGKARFVVTFSSRCIGELGQHACFPLLKPYIQHFDSVSQDPLSFLTQFTGLDRLPVYSERNLWKVLFYATVLALERTVLDEEQLQREVLGLQLIESDKARHAFYEWDELPPPSKLRSVYFESMGFSDAEERLSKQDESFYLAKCFKHFADLGLLSTLQAVLPASSRSSDQFRMMATLKKQELASQQLAKAVRFWQKLAIKHLLCEDKPPYQSMGPTSEHIRNDPNLRRSIEEIGQVLGAPSPFKEKRIPREAARTSFRHLYSLTASQSTIHVSTTEHLLNSFLTEYERRLDEYRQNELAQLLRKTVNIALVTHAYLSLHGKTLSGQEFALFPRLWRNCFSRLGSSLTLSTEQRENMWQELETLSLFDSRFRDIAKSLFARSEEIDAITEKASQALRDSDPVEAFLTFFAGQLREHDYFLNLHEWRSLASPLARSYCELDEQLLRAQPPLSSEYQRRHSICNLVSEAQTTTEYDRVFILIIDGLSYLEWKLIQPHFRDLADEDIRVSEQYAFAPIPTYTPANTTCLITGFEPSEIGVCDWRIKPVGQKALDIKDNAAKSITKDIGRWLSPRHSLTLVHNQVGSNLTHLWMALAKIEEVAIPTTESRKAIAQVREQIYQLDPANKVVVVYIADFDEAGHWYLRMDGWTEYYSLLARRIKENLVLPILGQAKKKREKTLVILTADHGKLSGYESRMLLELAVPGSDAFRKCTNILENCEIAKSARHIVAWVPNENVDEVESAIQQATENQPDVVVYLGEDVSHLLPHVSKTSLVNPNIIILSRFGISGGGAMGHGGGSLSEVIVPAVRFSWR